jgi:hypothetical protein
MVGDKSAPSSDGVKRFSVEQLRSILTRVHLIGVAKSFDQAIRQVLPAGIELLRELTRFPFVGPRVVPLLARIDQTDRFHFELSELIRVCSALNDERLSYWVTGGWGIDVLAGCQTRRHSDLDFALDSPII